MPIQKIYKYDAEKKLYKNNIKKAGLKAAIERRKRRILVVPKSKCFFAFLFWSEMLQFIYFYKKNII